MKMKKYKKYLLERFTDFCLKHPNSKFYEIEHDFMLDITDFIYANGEELHKNDIKGKFDSLAIDALYYGFYSKNHLLECPSEDWGKTVVDMATTYLLETKLRKHLMKIWREHHVEK